LSLTSKRKDFTSRSQTWKYIFR